MPSRILVGDIGSTTTKLLLLEEIEGKFVSLGSTAVPTTVEKPAEDVCIGFFRAVRDLEQSTGLNLRTAEGRLSVPFHTTSSAGGGLQILVIGLASGDSGAMATATAYSSGGVVLDTFSIDDDIPRVEKIRRMQHLSPDLVIMAGGFENGAVAGVVNMAQIVALAGPRPKFGKERLPLVFCGNSRARPYIESLLGKHFAVSFVDNIRPDGLNYNLGPARREVHRLFMDHVMQMAPGYSKLTRMTSSPIIPTPSAVERILELYARSTGGAVVLADMGGATTDVFTGINGRFQRTVAANVGLSYSLSNIVREAGREAVFGHTGFIPEEDAGNWILSKTLFPTAVPDSEAACALESAAAAEGMKLAWRHHLEMSYTIQQAGFTERIRRLGRCRFDETFSTPGGESFSISDIRTIIGAGGIMAHSSPRRAAWILVTGFRPKGLTTLMVDRHFHSPHMGILADERSEQALDYYLRECLVKVARVYSPVRKTRSLRIDTPSGRVKVASGGFLYLESSKGVSVPGLELPQDDVPLLVDMRFEQETLPMDFRQETGAPGAIGDLPCAGSPVPESADLTRDFSLAYRGEILVEASDEVSSGDVLGENMLAPPMVYFVDIRARIGYDRTEISDETILENLEVKPGDRVSIGQRIMCYRTGSGVLGIHYNVTSPVRGRVTAVKRPGLVIMEEIQDYDGKPHFVNVARLLGVKPRRITANMKVRKGDFVQSGQVIAVGERLRTVKSPSAGTVTELDTRTGIVTIQYLIQPVKLFSPMFGRVSSVEPGLSVKLAAQGVLIPGTVAFGRTRWGTLVTGTPRRGSILLLKDTVTPEQISAAVEAGAAGIVAPSIQACDLVEFLGMEPGVILTGDEDLPLSVMILRGAGSIGLHRETFEKLSSMSGGNCALFTTTRLRAGVERPMLLVQGTGVDHSNNSP